MEDERFYHIDHLLKLASQNPEIVQEMIDLFLKQTPESFLLIEKLYEENKWNELQREIHRLKSSMAVFGIKIMQEKLQTVETELLEKKDFHLIPEQINEICTLGKIVILQIEKDKQILLKNGKE